MGFQGVAEGNLEMLFIHPDHRGKGIGKALLKHAIQKLRITKVDVNEQNVQALGFYEHAGFAEHRSMKAWEIFFSFVLNSTLSLLLVFRLNRAASRFWLARQFWGDIVARSRSMGSGILGSMTNSMTSNHMEKLERGKYEIVPAPFAQPSFFSSHSGNPVHAYNTIMIL